MMKTRADSGESKRRPPETFPTCPQCGATNLIAFEGGSAHAPVERQRRRRYTPVAAKDTRLDVRADVRADGDEARAWLDHNTTGRTTTFISLSSTCVELYQSISTVVGSGDMTTLAPFQTHCV